MNRFAGVSLVFLLCGLLVISGCAGGTPAPPDTSTVSNPVPSVSAVTPSSVLAGSGDASVVITGTGFVAGSRAQWNGTPVTTTYTSALSLSATLPASSLATATTAKLNVVNPPPGGGASPAIDFSVNNPVPAITILSPASATAGAATTTLDVQGSHFVAGTLVLWNNAPLATSPVSSTELKATLPAADLSGSSASLITLQNPAPGGGTSAAAVFDVNSPPAVITSISPRTVSPGQSATITITGTGFESNSVVLWNGIAQPTTPVSTTVLQVLLSATALLNPGAGSLVVSNPGPAPSTSSPAQLVVAAQPIPAIESVSIAAAASPTGGCPQLQVTITGTNFNTGTTIQVNNVSLPNTLLNAGLPTTLTNYLPLGFVSRPGALSFTVTNPGQVPTVSNTFPYPVNGPAALTLCVTPSPTTVYQGSGFSFDVQPSEVNINSNPNLTLGSLPAGITATTPSVPLPPGGTTLHLQAASSTATGTYDLTMTAATGTVTAAGDFNFTVSAGVPGSFSFLPPNPAELGVPIGGSAGIQYGTSGSSFPSVDFDVTPSVSGLPPGTSATLSPALFRVGQSVTVTLTAAANAPVTQNETVTLTGTPTVQLPAVTTSFLADVTQPPGSLPTSRTDFTSTAGSPYAAAYDTVHDLIFSSNPDWNRVDVISHTTHKILKSIPVRSPRGLDITQDNTHVWVQTASQYIYAIDTVSLHAQQYAIPSHTFISSGLPVSFATDRLLALSDGTLFLSFNDSGRGGGGEDAVWNPQTNQLTVLSPAFGSSWGTPVRSGDGRHVYAPNVFPASGMEAYDTASQTLSTIGSGSGYAPIVAVNNDGSRIVLPYRDAYTLYDNSLNSVGTFPGSGVALDVDTPLTGGGVFSSDGTTFYETAVVTNNLAVLLTIDVASQSLVGTAPAAPTDPVGSSGENGTATPFAVDAQGIVLGLQNYGIAFDDATFYQNYAVNQPGTNGSLEFLSTFGGPLAGGTPSSFNQYPSLTPDVWFGETRGSTDISSGSLTFTSPPSTVPGPVNVKFNFPDGTQLFFPQLFGYGTVPEYAVISGSGPGGGAPGQILGYGLPQDPSGGTLTVGANAATITTTAGQYPPFSAEPYPSTLLNYTFPAGTPGWADLQISTPAGAGTLAKSVFYARSVTDYASSDSWNAVLVDQARNQLYLSAGDHIDVFSTTSNQFIAQLHPASQGAQKQFVGLALTPDGSQLLAANLPDGSLAVINPDVPSSTFAIPIAPATGVGTSCVVGPIYVAAASANQAFVTTDAPPGSSCNATFATSIYIANLQTHTATAQSFSQQCTGGSSVDASGDGNTVVFGASQSGACIYYVQSATYNSDNLPAYQGAGTGVAMSSDANVIGSNQAFGDTSADLLGTIAHPTPLYGNDTQETVPPYPLQRPRFNASGGLYYLAYPNYVEIIDVPHAALRMRFSLTETIQDLASPMAIDSGGRYVYLLTDKGLTVVDLGAALLSVGHLSQVNVSAGTQIVVRGSGFDSATRATVGGLAGTVSFSDQNTLTLTIPPAAPGPEDIVITRSDGESYTLENAVVLQ